MSRAGSIAAVLMLLGCGESATTGGAGGGGAGGGVGGTGGQPPGCVDIAVSTEGLPDASAYSKYARALPGGLWRDGDIVSLAWVAKRINPQEQLYGHEVLVVERFDLATGAKLEQRLIELFAPDVDETDAGIGMATGAPSGEILTYFALSGSLWFRVVRPDGTQGADTPDPLDPGLGLPTMLDWDGESFVSHGHGGPPPRPLYSARFGLEGELTLPATPFGTCVSANADLSGYAVSTDPVGGRTWVVDHLAGNWTSAHERDGTPVFEPSFQLPLALDDSPLATRIEAHPAGIELTWYEKPLGVSHQFVMSVDDTGTVVAGPQEIFGLGGAATGFTHSGVHRTPDGHLWVVGSLGPGGGAVFLEADLETGAQTDAAVFFDDASHTGTLTMLRNMELWDDDHGVWVGFEEAVGARSWRVLKLAPGCVYPSWREANGL